MEKITNLTFQLPKSKLMDTPLLENKENRRRKSLN
jgi:hypothetical protein